MKRVLGFFTRRRLLWIAGSLAGIVGFYALLGFLILPLLARHYLPKIATEQIKRDLSVEEIKLNPFRLTLEIRGFGLKEPEGEELVRFQRLFVDLDTSWSDLWNHHWTVADLQLERPSANLVIDGKSRLNLAKIADDLPKSDEPEPPPQDSPPPTVWLKHLLLSDGLIHFADRSKAEPIEEEIEALSLELHNLSTLPGQQGKQHIAANLGSGGQLEWEGTFDLNPVSAEGAISLKGFKLQSTWKFLRDKLNLAEPAGEVDIGTQYRLAIEHKATQLALSKLGLQIKGLKLVPAGKPEPMLSLEKIELAEGSFDLASHAVRIPRFELGKGQVLVTTDSAGVLNWQTLVKPAPTVTPVPAAPQAPPQPKEPPWHVQMDAFGLNDLSVKYVDASRKTPLRAELAGLGVNLGLELEAGDAPPKVLVQNLGVGFGRLALSAEGLAEPVISLDSGQLEAGQLDLASRTAQVGQIVLRGGHASATRLPDGAIQPLAQIVGAAASPTSNEPHAQVAEPQSAQPAKPEDGKAWQFSLGHFALEGFGLSLADRSLTPPVAYDLRDLAVSVRNISNDGKTPVDFETSLRVEQGGKLSITGNMAQDGARADAKFAMERLNLTPLQAFVAQVGALKMEKAELSTALQIAFRNEKNGQQVKAAGKLNLSDLLLKEVKTGKRFLSWKDLNAEGIDFSLSPNKLAIKEIRIVQPGANIEIFKDESTNVAAIFSAGKPSPARKGEPDKGPAKAPLRKAEAKAAKSTPPAAKGSEPFPVVIQRVRVDRGEVDFSNEALVLPFATRIHNFGGTITGISTAPTARTLLDFTGNVDEYGEVKLGGSLSPQQPKVFSDVKLSFRNVDLSSLSPYSGTFAGRKLQSGKLNLDLQYNIENGKLNSNNSLVLERISLGEQVESPRAASLPLDLAIALLTDSEGRINASIPVTGDVNSPEFAYGKVIWNALVNLITKAVTAPFRAIGGLFGSGEEDIGAINFEPGKDVMPPPEREKLKQVASALAKRSAVKVEVHGGFDPKLDGNALKSLDVRRAVAGKLGFDLQAGEDPGPVAFDDAGAQKALEELAMEKGGPAFAGGVQAELEKAKGRKINRVGKFSSLLGKASEDREFYEVLFARLQDASPLTDSRLKALADQRGKAVAEELSRQPEMGPSRVKAAVSKPAEGKDERVPTLLDLSAGG